MATTMPPDAAKLAKAAALLQALEDTQTAFGSSRWAAYRRCPREHHLRYHVGVERLGRRAVHFGVGSLCHGILRYLQDGVLAGEPATRNWEDVLEAASNAGEVPEVLDEAHRLMRWYWAFWGTDNAGWHAEAKIAGVELHLQTPDEGFALPHTGRADTVLDLHGTILIVDTKTRGRSFPKEDDLAEYITGLATRPQFLSLAYMLQQAWKLDEPPHVMINGICKLKMPTFQRIVVPITQMQVDAWAESHKGAASRGLDGDWPNYDACAPEMGWKCSYFQHCHALSDEARALHYQIKSPTTATPKDDTTT